MNWHVRFHVITASRLGNHWVKNILWLGDYRLDLPLPRVLPCCRIFHCQFCGINLMRLCTPVDLNILVRKAIRWAASPKQNPLDCQEYQETIRTTSTPNRSMPSGEKWAVGQFVTKGLPKSHGSHWGHLWLLIGRRDALSA